MQFTFSDLTFAFIVMAGAITIAWPMWAIDAAIHSLIEVIREGHVDFPKHHDRS